MSAPKPWFTPEERLQRHNVVSRQYRVLHRKRALQSGRKRNHDMRSCVVSQEEYDLLLSATHCAICGVEFIRIPSRNSRAPVLDHCHITGRPRKAICRICNIGLGCFKDSLEKLLQAAEYLKGFEQHV
jgi:hypothetical protein